MGNYTSVALDSHTLIELGGGGRGGSLNFINTQSVFFEIWLVHLDLSAFRSMQTNNFWLWF